MKELNSDSLTLRRRLCWRLCRSGSQFQTGLWWNTRSTGHRSDWRPESFDVQNSLSLIRVTMSLLQIVIQIVDLLQIKQPWNVWHSVISALLLALLHRCLPSSLHSHPLVLSLLLCILNELCNRKFLGRGGSSHSLLPGGRWQEGSRGATVRDRYQVLMLLLLLIKGGAVKVEAAEEPQEEEIATLLCSERDQLESAGAIPLLRPCRQRWLCCPMFLE